MFHGPSTTVAVPEAYSCHGLASLYTLTLQPDKEPPTATVILSYIQDLSECMNSEDTPPNSGTKENWCHLQVSPWNVPKGLHWSVWQDIETLSERAQEGPTVRRGSTFSSGRIMKEDHTIKWEDAEMMNHSQWYQQRCTLAAWHIQSEKHRMTEMKAPFQLCITLLSTYHTQTHTTDGMFLPTSIDSSKWHAHFYYILLWFSALFC